MKQMSSGSWAAYQECAERPDYDPSDDIPIRKTHCKCGSFLPIKPYFEGGRIMRSYPTYDPQTGLVDENEVEEYADPYWRCPKCGQTYDVDEVWK
ncbi:hypothetical protein M0R72_20615 [Candidatus Pacearchaeota archaeon]|jgi:hypothetical protein|nr:hypothetical protein [Candidatus Pacearchaeota archaeon]